MKFAETGPGYKGRRDKTAVQGAASFRHTMAASNRYTLRMQAHKGQLPLLQEFVEDCAPSLYLSRDAVIDILVAVTEIVTNSIVHGYAGRPGSIDVEMWTVERDLYVRVCDEAPVFDSTSISAPDTTLPLDARSLGGMGIHVARRFTDSMTHHVLPEGGNELTLVRNDAVEQGEP